MVTAATSKKWKLQTVVVRTHFESGDVFFPIYIQLSSNFIFHFFPVWFFSKDSFVLQGITFTLVGAMVFTTITILALKISSSSLIESQDRAGAEEKTWFKISPMISALTLNTVTHFLQCASVPIYQVE